VLLTDGKNNVYFKNSDGSYTVIQGRLPASLGISTKSEATLATIRLQRYLLRDQAGKLLPRERVSYCMKRRIDKNKKVTILYNQTRKKAHFGNVIRCGSVWTCAYCAAKITEKRRVEMQAGTEVWKTKFNGSLLLLTTTNSHHASHALKFQKEGQKKAMKYFFGDRKGRDLFAQLGKKHHITNYEVTYGKNGWHPHHHTLLFIDVMQIGQRYVDIVTALKKHWINCCLKAGLPAPDMEHGLDIKNGLYASQYVSKWGLEHEMTKGHVKKGKEGGLTPFDLLKMSYEDKDAGKLFQEFAISFKGSRQLSWTKDLKKILGLMDKTDEQLSEETEKDSLTLSELDTVIFNLVVQYQMQPLLLSAYERDMENGCFGCGEADELINKVLATEIQRLQAA
jgi:hypothetical protein